MVTQLLRATLNYAIFSLIIIDLQGYPETQNPPGFGPWGFDPPSRHHDNKRLI
jgi:hypothetical protein